MRRALREHARIGRRHVGVRADDGREAAVEMPAHRDLLTRRLGVPVENAHARRVAQELFEQRVDRAERVVRRRHEGAADGIHDEDILDHDPAAPRIARREIDRPDREREELDVVEELPLIPDVIPIRDDVRAVRVELARDVGGESCSTRGVLAVHDREVDLALRADLRQECRYRVPTWSPDDITDKKDSHGLTRRRALTRTTRKRVEVRVSGCATEGPRARGVPIPKGWGSARREGFGRATRTLTATGPTWRTRPRASRG